jgi:hypothetical protein
MLIKILLVAAALIVVLVVVIALRPASFRYERSMTIAAPASAIFPLIDDQHQWLKWSPWANLDPDIKQSFEGAETGVGSIYIWEGNHEVGAGKITLVESKPGELVRFKLEFTKPFQGTNMADFTFKPEGDKTVVTWSTYGPNTFMSKAFGLFVNCEKMCGDMLEKGLVQLKGLAEGKG